MVVRTYTVLLSVRTYRICAYAPNIRMLRHLSCLRAYSSSTCAFKELHAVVTSMDKRRFHRNQALKEERIAEDAIGARVLARRQREREEEQVCSVFNSLGGREMLLG